MKVKIHSFAIGPEALDGPVAVVEMAARTGGYFTPVRRPGDLVSVIENVSFANIDEITVRNLTTGEPASELITSADGSFSALVPVQHGRNRIRVLARANDGSDATAEVTVDYVPGVKTRTLPRELMGQRNRLLEQRRGPGSEAPSVDLHTTRGQRHLPESQDICPWHRRHRLCRCLSCHQ